MNTPSEIHRILLVDDNQAIHEDFRKILCPPESDAAAFAAAELDFFGEVTPDQKLPRYEIDSAYQGEEALGLIQQSLVDGRPYAMAFMDVRMPPGWDGIETTAQIWQRYPDLQVVICTAYSDYSWKKVVEK